MGIRNSRGFANGRSGAKLVPGWRLGPSLRQGDAAKPVAAGWFPAERVAPGENDGQSDRMADIGEGNACRAKCAAGAQASDHRRGQGRAPPVAELERRG